MTEIKDEAKIGKRPLIITIICILVFIWAPVVFLGLVGLLIPGIRTLAFQIFPEYARHSAVMMSISILTVIFGFSGIIGYWKMRKWGVYLYSIICIVSLGGGLIFNIQTGVNILSYLLPIVILGIGFAYFKQMT